MPRRKSGKRSGSDVELSYFDLNQLELAFINRALRNPRVKTPPVVEIGKKKRILELQKKNLMRLCTKMRKERRAPQLEKELKRILGGKRLLSLRCLMFR
jgi:hypothetical protein